MGKSKSRFFEQLIADIRVKICDCSKNIDRRAPDAVWKMKMKALKVKDKH